MTPRLEDLWVNAIHTRSDRKQQSSFGNKTASLTDSKIQMQDGMQPFGMRSPSWTVPECPREYLCICSNSSKSPQLKLHGNIWKFEINWRLIYTNIWGICSIPILHILNPNLCPDTELAASERLFFRSFFCSLSEASENIRLWISAYHHYVLDRNSKEARA